MKVYKHKPTGRPFEYNGEVFQAYKWGNDYPYIEGCWNCHFGRKIVIGIKTQYVQGVPKEFNEAGFKCVRPKDFPEKHCTCIHRADNNNVYYKLISTEDEKIFKAKPKRAFMALDRACCKRIQDECGAVECNERDIEA